MYNLWLVIRTLISVFIITIFGILCAIPCLIIASLPKKWRFDNRLYYWVSYFFFQGCVLATFVPVRIKYEDENALSHPTIIIANHQSSFDIPLLGLVLREQPHIWLFLARFSKIPFFGYILSRMNIVVDHRGLRKLVGSIESTLQTINGRTSHIILFPEGGRYIDGTIHQFFYGFALLSKATGRPVVPVLICNAGKVFPPGAYLLRPHKVSLHVGKPIYFMPEETDEAFVQRVHAWFVEKNKECAL